MPLSFSKARSLLAALAPKTGLAMNSNVARLAFRRSDVALGNLSERPPTVATSIASTQEKNTADGTPSHIEILTTPAQLEGVRRFWEQTNTSPDLDFEQFTERMRTQNGSARPFVLSLSDRGRQTALIVGAIIALRPDWRLGYRSLSIEPVSCLQIDHGAVLGRLSDGDSRRVVERLVEELRHGSVDLIQARYLPTSSPLYTALKTVPGPLARDPVTELNPHWRLQLPPTYREFCRSRSKKMHAEIRLVTNRILKKFGETLSVEHYTRSDQIPEAIAAIAPIAARTYHSRLGESFNDSPELRTDWASAAERGWLNVHVLRIAGAPIAYWTGCTYMKQYFTGYTGFDPEFRHYHPGKYLLLRIIEQFCETGEVTTFDYGFSHEDWKRRLGTSPTEEAIVHLFAPTVRGVRLRMTRLMTSGTTKLTKSILARTNMLARLKKLTKTLATK